MPVGLAVEIPPGHAGLVVPRSGLAARHGITILNAPGLIDAGYRGELRVALLNTDRGEPFAIEAGDRIAQLVIVRRRRRSQPVLADELSAQRARRGRLRLHGTAVSVHQQPRIRVCGPDRLRATACC